ncbi:MAG: NADH-quinone oxidoreductase subunit J, partial [Caulobacteraceae bacterium]
MSFAGNVLFGLCALVALLSAVGVVAMRSPIRAAMSLLAHIVALAGLFLTLHAHLLAALQVLVYAGAVVVLFVFVIMLIGARVPEPPPDRGWVVKATAAALVGLLTFGLAAALAPFSPARPVIAGCAQDAGPECAPFGGVDAFSRELYRGGMVPFELISVL